MTVVRWAGSFLLGCCAGVLFHYALYRMGLPVEPFMTPNPETVTAEDTLAFALHKMDIGGYRHLPVLTDDRPSGVISVRDLLRHFTRLCKDT